MIHVVGHQKLVKDLHEGFRRVREYCRASGTRAACWQRPSSSITNVAADRGHPRPGNIGLLIRRPCRTSLMYAKNTSGEGGIIW